MTCLHNSRKTTGIQWFCVSAPELAFDLSALVGFIVFFTVVATSFDEAFGNGETTVEVPAETVAYEETAEAEEAPVEATPEAGTRENPYPIGSTITQGDWAVTVNGVTLDATEAVANENPFNEVAPEGSAYILVSLTATYNGTDGDGEAPWVSVEYVTAGGNTVNSFDNMAVAPEAFDLMSTLYSGASATGNFVLAAPVDGLTEGVLAITPGMIGDKVFVAVQ